MKSQGDSWRGEASRERIPSDASAVPMPRRSLDITAEAPRGARPRTRAASGPGLTMIFTDRKPCLDVLPLADGPLVLGRQFHPSPWSMDPCLSRMHAELSHDGKRWVVRDLDSRNGTFVDGAPVRGTFQGGARVLRLGGSVCLLTADVACMQSRPEGVTAQDGQVVGPTLCLVLQRLDRMARASRVLLITGESGTGKELAARRFHAIGGGGPFVAVNCAAIPDGLAERLLFGTQKGAYSGADADADGYIQSAHGGTLFLDEIGDLDLMTQAKLLRVLESREVLPLGASRPRPVDFRLVTATHRDLRCEAAAGRFRHDLYYRLGRPELRLPPLRERLEDLPFLAAQEIERSAPGLSLHARFIEQCCLRQWPGNVRELAACIRQAALEALAARETILSDEYLADDLGSVPVPSSSRAVTPAGIDRTAVEAALADAGGNVSQAARSLGLHRTQLYRLLRKLAVEAR
jgi:hypothetical protein